MKKIFLLPAGLILALGFQSCQDNNADDMGRYQHNIDSTVNARLVALRDSMNMECTKMVMSAAQGRVDSLMALNTGTPKSGTKTTKPTTTTTTTTTTAPVDPKAGKMSGNNNTDSKKDKMEGNKTSGDSKGDKMNRPK